MEQPKYEDYKWTIPEFIKWFCGGYDDIPEWMKNNINNPDIFIIITKEEIIQTDSGFLCKAIVRAVDKNGNFLNLNSQDTQGS